MSTRRKKGGFRVVPDGARGERRRSAKGSAKGAPVVVDRGDAGSALERLFEAWALRPLAEEHERAVSEGRAPVEGVPSLVSLEWKIKRARRALPLHVRGEATRVLAELDGRLRMVAREAAMLGTYAETLPVLARFAVLAATIMREENPTSVLERAAAMSAAFWQSQRERDEAYLHATPPGHRAKVGTKKTEKGEKGDEAGVFERSSTADYAERHQRAKESASQARQERIALLDQLKGRPASSTTTSAMEARVEALIERDARLAEEGRKILAERAAKVIDVAPEPAPVAATPAPVPSSAPSTEHDEAVARPTRTRPSTEGTPDPGAVAWNERALRMLNPHYEPEASAPPAPPTNPPKPEPVTPITYEVAKPGEPVRPSWWGGVKADAPAVADPFAAIKAAHAGDPVAMAFAAYRDVVGPAKDKAQLARDTSRAYSGPRHCPAFVTRWLRATGRHREIDHLRFLGFFVEEEGSN